LLSDPVMAAYVVGVIARYHLALETFIGGLRCSDIMDGAAGKDASTPSKNTEILKADIYFVPAEEGLRTIVFATRCSAG
jgi:hypothetical protein